MGGPSRSICRDGPGRHKKSKPLRGRAKTPCAGEVLDEDADRSPLITGSRSDAAGKRCACQPAWLGTNSRGYAEVASLDTPKCGLTALALDLGSGLAGPFAAQSQGVPHNPNPICSDCCASVFRPSVSPAWKVRSSERIAASTPGSASRQISSTCSASRSKYW